MAARAKGRDPRRAWRRLLENPDYIADWRANAGPTVREAPPYVFRRQTEPDLRAARWNLLAWEDPHNPQWAVFFRSDVAMVKVRVADPGPYGRHSWPRLVRRAGATFAGLRLLDRTLVLKVSRGRETRQIEVIGGAGFDAASSGLEVAARKGGSSPENWVRVESLDATVFRSPGDSPSGTLGT